MADMYLLVCSVLSNNMISGTIAAALGNVSDLNYL